MKLVFGLLFAGTLAAVALTAGGAVFLAQYRLPLEDARPWTLLSLSEALIAVETENPIQSLDLQIGSDHISRASLDIVFLTQSCMEEPVDQIDEVVIESTYTNHPTQSGTDTVDLTGG